MTKLLRADAFDERHGVLQMETHEGALELRFTYDDAERLIGALQKSQERIQAQRVHSAKPPIPEKPKIAERWETAIDPINQVAVLRAHFADRTSQALRIPRSEIDAVVRFLADALKRFQGGAEMRQ